MAKMWAGVTDGATAKIADDFNSSIHFDSRMYRQDITGSMAHATMLAAKGIIGKADADAIILAADTTVALDGVCLGKPRDTADATAMLMSLSGRTHTVYTAVSVAYRGRLLTRVEATGVRFRAFDRREAEEYVKTGEPMDKAGSYGIQGLGGRLVLGIDGEFDNVVGLPCRLVDALLSEVTA